MATVAFACSTCGKQFRVAPEHAGRKVKCPHCETPNSVPPSVFGPIESSPEAVRKTPDSGGPVHDVPRSVKGIGKRETDGGARTGLRSLIERLPQYWALLAFDRLCVILAVLCVAAIGVEITLLIVGFIWALMVAERRVYLPGSTEFLFPVCAMGLALVFMVAAHWTRMVRDACLHLAEIAILQRHRGSNPDHPVAGAPGGKAR